MLTLPFAHLNLRYNPFGQIDPPLRAALAVVSLPEPSTTSIVQWVGAAGRGKSTHLLALHYQHPESVYEYIAAGQHRFRTAPHSTPLFLLDEAQRLSRWQLRRLCTSFAHIVISSHVDLSARLKRPVQTLRLHGLSRTRLAEIVSRRIEAARRGPGPVPQLSEAALDQLLRRHHDDVRAIESELYEIFQRIEEPGYVHL